MKVSEAFPTKYISAADLQDRNHRLIMQHAQMEKVGEDQKLVLYFKGKEKGLVLNKTNATSIAHAYGDDTDDWAGQEIIVFPTMTEYQGKQVEAVRVRSPQPKDNKPEPQQQRAPAMADDDIPF